MSEVPLYGTHERAWNLVCIREEKLIVESRTTDMCTEDRPCKATFLETMPKIGAQGGREFFIDNLLVRIHLIIEMILVDRRCTMGA